MKKTFRILTILSLMTLTIMAAACSSAAKTAEKPREDAVVIAQPAPVTGIRGNGASYLPKAIIYKTNGDYNDLVPVNLNPDGTLLSYPDPTDVGKFSTPLPLADGWLLDRRGGIGPGTRFTRWTYPQYHALPQVPSPDALLQNLVPEARVTEAYRLPINAHPADTALCNQYIRQGLPNCTKLL